MRNKVYSLAVVLVVAALLSACGPVAAIAETASTLTSTQSQPAAPAAGGPIQVQPSGSSASAQAQAQQANPGVRTLAVTGTGRATLTPDLAYINIGVHTENVSVSEAMAENKTQTQKVTDAIKAEGIDPKDIQTTNFNVYPMQKTTPSGQPMGTSYTVDNSVFVTVRDMSKLGTLLDSAAQNGANNINGIQFDVADKTTALSGARKEAVKNAEELAKELAAAAGVQLGPIQSINVNSNNVPLPMYGMGGGAASAVSAAVPVSAGQMILSVDVNLVFQIQ